MKLLIKYVIYIFTAVMISNTVAFAGFWESKGMCAIFEKSPEMKQTDKVSEAMCTQIQASGTGVFQQDFMQGDKVLFSVHAENYPDTEHMEYRTETGPAFYSGEVLYDYKSCYVIPSGNGLLFYCFRADDE